MIGESVCAKCGRPCGPVFLPTAAQSGDVDCTEMMQAAIDGCAYRCKCPKESRP